MVGALAAVVFAQLKSEVAARGKCEEERVAAEIRHRAERVASEVEHAKQLAANYEERIREGDALQAKYYQLVEDLMAKLAPAKGPTP